MVILATTNEQVNNHITEYFDKKKIMYQNKSLKTGDYCFKLKENPEQGRFLEQYFTEELFIERKNSLSELASSIKDNAFHNELKRAKLIKYKFQRKFPKTEFCNINKLFLSLLIFPF